MVGFPLQLARSLAVTFASTLALSSFAGGQPTAPLRSTDGVRRLPLPEASLARPVKLRGVVTYHDAEHGILFLQDAAGGISVRLNGHGAVGFETGDFVEIQGTTGVGDFAPMVLSDGRNGGGLRKLGSGEFPIPVSLAGSELLQPQHHGLWVELPGLTRSLRWEAHQLFLEVASNGQVLTVIVPGHWSETNLPRHLLFREARFHGAHAAVADAGRRLTGVRLYVPSLDQIVVDQGAGLDVFTQPEQRVDELLRFVPESRRRVRVRGVVTLLLPGEGVFVRGAGGSIFAALEQSERSDSLEMISPGDHLDIAGYPALRAEGLVLEDAVWQFRGEGPPPKPLAATAEQALLGSSNGELILVEATLLNSLRRNGRQLLILRSGHRDFTAEQAGAGSGVIRVALAPGSTVRISGVCRPEISKTESGVRSIRLLMRGADDVTLLRKPSFWTLRRALLALGGVTSAAAAALTWSIVLRHRVLKQTGVIAEKIEGERIVEERSRIARDLHDSLQQELAGIGLQLSTTDTLLLKDIDAARSSLQLARSMLRRSQEEARRSIWDLQPLDLTTGDLASALQEHFLPLDDPDGVRVEVAICGDASDIPPLTEAHLLRIAQEAVTNALKHAAPAHVSISLAVDSERIALRVIDDGGGFDIEHSDVVARYKFGLGSMRERTNKMEANLEIESAPGQGTRISVFVPRVAGVSPQFSAQMIQTGSVR